MDKIFRGLIVTLCGIVTTLLTAAGLAYLELRYDCSIYGFALPFGAIISGLIAASGYFLGSRFLSYRPGRGMLVGMLGVSGANFFFINWLEYRSLQVDGKYVRSWMTFPAYLKYVLTHTSISIGVGGLPSDKFELGVGGYLCAALLIFGFACGGYFIFFLLRALPYCDACGLYMIKHGSQTRYFVRHESLAECAAAFQAEMQRKQFRRAMEVHSAAGAREIDETSGYSLRAQVRHCGRCQSQWVSLIAKQRVNKSWRVLSGVRYTAYCTEQVAALEQMA